MVPQAAAPRGDRLTRPTTRRPIRKIVNVYPFAGSPTTITVRLADLEASVPI